MPVSNPSHFFFEVVFVLLNMGMLEMKSEVTEEEIKREIISLCNDYKKLGIDISVKDIEIVYEDGVKYIKHNFDKD